MTQSQHAEISTISIEDEMRNSYLDYAMSVIVSRALPDVRDGLKPVHRRILFSMKESGFDSNKPYKKSARIVGDVMGKYHPHGDTAIYDSMVRMAQDFSMRLPLIDGQGNYGSMDGDSPAAMRYTEARLEKAAEAMLDDIDKDTVDFQGNYDDSIQEPTVLPSRIPNILVNGGSGIAVGMATNIPPHNLGEVIDACCAYIDNPDITLDELIEFVPGPDFPTGGIILGRNGARSGLTTGRGSVVLRSKTHIEDVRKDRPAIIITEIPYQVNKAKMIERIAEVVKDKIVEGIADLRDESDRDGVRVVVELKRDAVADVVLAQLYKFTPLQTSFGVNTLALHHGQPRMFNLHSIIEAFVEFRKTIITRRTQFELRKAREKAHLLVGLGIAVVNLDAMIKLIREAADPAIAREQLVAKKWPVHDIRPMVELIDEPGRGVDEQDTYQLSELQAKAILDLRLHRLTGLERDKIQNDLREITEQIAYCLAILGNREKLMAVLREELVDIKLRFATPRKTEIQDLEFEADLEDLIQKEDMIVTVSNTGYIKRVPISTYRAQRRGGKGKSGMDIKDTDFVTDVFVANTHTPVLFFSNLGIVYRLKVYKLPLGSRQARGKALINLLPLKENESITTVLPLPEDEATWKDLQIFFCTSKGYVRRNQLSDFENINAKGKIAYGLDEDDHLIGVTLGDETQDVLISTVGGRSVRFPFADVRVFKGRKSHGVRAVRLQTEDEVVSLALIHNIDTTATERVLYLKQAAALRRSEMLEEDEDVVDDLSEVEDGDDTIDAQATLSPERFEELAKHEDFVMVVTDRGYGKRTSSYNFRRTRRGSQGVKILPNNGDKIGKILGAFPIHEDEQILMVTDQAQMIRLPVHDVRICSRTSKGVILFRIEPNETVVSAAHLTSDQIGEEEDEDAIIETSDE